MPYQVPNNPDEFDNEFNDDAYADYQAEEWQSYLKRWGIESIDKFGAQFGLSPNEIRGRLQNRFPDRVPSPAEAERFLNEEFDVHRYNQYVQTFQNVPGRREQDPNSPWTRGASTSTPVSIAEWQRMPEHRRLRMTAQKHISTFGKDTPESQGYTTRKDEQFAYPIESLYKGSHLGLQRAGDSHLILSTFEKEKLIKRQQMLGAHEMVQLQGPGISPSAPAPMRSGPMSQRPETVQNIRAALVVGGDPGVPGQFVIDRSAVTEATKRITKRVYGEGLTGLVQPGQEFGVGQDVRLAQGLNPLDVNPKYGHRVMNMREIAHPTTGKSGYEFALEQFAPTESALIRSKAFSTKAVGTTADLSRITSASGQALNVQMLGGLKDIGGYVFSHFMAQKPEYMAEKLGMSVEQLQSKSYAELGEAPLQAFREKVLPDVLQTIHAPTLMHRSMLERMDSRSLATNPKTGKPYAAVSKGNDQVEVMMQYQALVGDIAAQFSEDFPVRNSRLSVDELASLQRVNPQLHSEITGGRHSRQVKRSYENLVNAALASTGEYSMPRGTISAADPRASRTINALMERTAIAARSMVPDLPADKPVPEEILNTAFRQEWFKKGGFLNVPTPIGNVVLPPGRTLQQFAAKGIFEGQEVSEMVKHTRNLMSAYVSGNEKPLTEMARRYRSHQMEIAGGEETLSNAMSAFPGGRMHGSVVHGSQSLAPHEVYVPGMAGQAVNLMRFPSQGGQEYGVRLQSLTEQQIRERNLNPESMYAGIDVQQALAGDYDGDLDYAIRVGSVQVGRDGKLYTTGGKQLTSPAQLKIYADQAKTRGAANIEEDIAGSLAGKNLTREAALSQLQHNLSPEGLSAMTPMDLQRQVESGQQRYGVIGRYYNTFTKGLSTLQGVSKQSRQSRAAMQTLFNVSHGITQRPEKLPGELQKIQNLMGWNPASQGTTPGYYKDIESGDPRHLTSPTFSGARIEATEALIKARSPKTGEYFMNEEELANLIATEGTAGATSQAVKAYRDAGGDIKSQKQQLSNIVNQLYTDEWLTETGLGRMIGGNAARLAANKGWTAEQLAQVERGGISTNTAQRLMEFGQIQQAAVLARRKPHGLIGEQARQASLIERVQAAQSLGMGNFVERNRQFQYDRPIGPEPQAPPIASASGVNLDALYDGSTVAGGAGQPPAGGPPADTAAPADPGDGDGGRSPRGRKQQIIAEKMQKGQRLTANEWAEIMPSTMTAQKYGAVSTLYQHLWGDEKTNPVMGAIQGALSRGQGINRKENPAAYNVMQAAMQAAPHLAQWNRQAHVIARTGNSEIQRALAGNFVDMAETILGVNLAEGIDPNMSENMARAFQVGIHGQINPGAFEATQGYAKTATMLHTQQDRFKAIMGKQGARRLGFNKGRQLAQEAMLTGEGEFGYRARLLDLAGGTASDDVRARATSDLSHEELISLGSRELSQRWSTLQGNYSQASGGEQRRLAPEINSIADAFKSIRDEASPLTATIREYRKEMGETLKIQREYRSEIKERLSSTESSLSAVRGKISDLTGVTDPRSVQIREALEKEESKLTRRLTGQRKDLRSAEYGIGETMGQISELGVPSIGGMRAGHVKPPESWMGALQRHAVRELDPQRLFYQSQMIAQGYYMLGMPLMEMRQEHLQGQLTEGQLSFSLGLGGVGPEVEQMRRQRATIANFREGAGQGVNELVAPVIDWIGSRMEQSEDFAPTIGKWATGALATVPALMIANKFGAGRGASWLANQGSRLLSGRATQSAGSQLIASRLAGAGLGEAAAATAGGAASVAAYAAPVAGGILAGNEITDYIKGDDDYSGRFWRQLLTAPSALATKGLLSGYESTGLMSPESANALGQQSGRIYEAFGNRGFGAAADTVSGMFGYQTSFGGGSPDQQTGPRDEIHVRDERLADLIKDFTEKFPEISNQQAKEIIKAYSDITGTQYGGVQAGQSRQLLDQITETGLKAGIEPEQLIQFIGGAPKAAGVGAGSPETNRILKMFTGIESFADMERMMQSLGSVSGSLQSSGLYGNLENVTQQYGNLLRDKGEYKAQRYLSEITGGTSYDWSKLAYGAGMGHLALQDEQETWRPKYEREFREIEDRRRQEDISKELGTQVQVFNAQGTLQSSYWQGGRQEEQITFQKQQLAMEEEFWDFRMEKREQDYGFQVRQNDLTIRQMEWNLQKEDELAKIQERNFKRNYEINLQLFDLQTKWREQDFTKQEQRLDVQRGWQVEDQAYSRETFELQAGWGQEDLERNLRYSTGRQRLDIRRQMERQGVMNNMKRSQMAREESRSQTRYEWGVEDIETERERWAISRPLQREQMTSGFEYNEKMMEFREQDRAFRVEQIQLMKDRGAAYEETYAKETGMMIEQHELETAINQQKIQWAEEDMQRARERAEEDDQVLEMSRQLQEAQQLYNMKQQVGLETAKEWNVELAKMVEYMNQLAGGSQVETPELTGDSQTKSPTHPDIVQGLVSAQEQQAQVLKSYGEQQSGLLAQILVAITAVLKDSGKELIIEMDGERVGEIVLSKIMSEIYDVRGPR